MYLQRIRNCIFLVFSSHSRMTIFKRDSDMEDNVFPFQISLKVAWWYNYHVIYCPLLSFVPSVVQEVATAPEKHGFLIHRVLYAYITWHCHNLPRHPHFLVSSRGVYKRTGEKRGVLCAYDLWSTDDVLDQDVLLGSPSHGSPTSFHDNFPHKASHHKKVLPKFVVRDS